MLVTNINPAFITDGSITQAFGSVDSMRVIFGGDTRVMAGLAERLREDPGTTAEVETWAITGYGDIAEKAEAHYAEQAQDVEEAKEDPPAPPKPRARPRSRRKTS